MKRTLSTSLFFLLLSNICFCQNDWVSGYILKNTGDTIRGFIDNRDSKSNTKQCYFKAEKKGDVQIYTPQELSGFRFQDGKYYISKTIKEQEAGKQVFLEFLIHGKINVYHMKDDQDRYFVEKDSIIYELKNTEVLKHINYPGSSNENNYSIQSTEKKEYIGLLTALLKDAEIQQDILKCELRTKSLIKIAREYHEKVCSDEKCIIYEKASKPMHVNLGILAGVSINTLDFGEEVVSNFGPGSFLGLRVEFENALEWQENLSVVLDLTLQHYTNYTLRANDANINHYINYNNVAYSLNNSSEVSVGNRNRLNVNINTIALKIPLTLNYTFSKGKFRPYAGGGIENIFILSQNENFVYKKFYDVLNQSIPSYQIGLVGRAGSKYLLKNNHLLYAELNYEISKSLNINRFLRLTNNLLSIAVGYNL